MERKFFKHGEMKISIRLTGHEASELEEFAAKNPEIVKEILRETLKGSHIVDGSTTYPRLAKLCKEIQTEEVPECSLSSSSS